MAEQQTRQPILQNQARQALQNGAELTDEQKKAIRAGSARAFYADLPGAFTDIAGTALDYGAEGLARLLPSDLAGYDLPKSLGIRGFQRAMRDPALGSKQLERVGEKAGYIPPTTGTQEEEMARLFMGLADPMPLPAGMTSRVFSSPAVKAVSEIKQNKMPANQWISQRKSRGVKQDELTWTGVEDWLKSQKGSVTKQELDEYLDANQIQVQEVVKGTASGNAKEQAIRNEVADELITIMDNDESLYLMRDEIQDAIEQYRYRGDIEVVKELNKIFEDYRDVDADEFAIPSLRKKYVEYFERNPREFERLAGGETQYGQYTLPGGDNYRELLLTLPSKRTADPEKRYEELMRIVDRRAPTEAESLEMEALENQMTGRSGSVGRDFISGHYKEPNIVAHIRFNERVDADGNKVLFIEEIQSDWAQAGRKQGFLTQKQDATQRLLDEQNQIVERAETGMGEDGGTFMQIQPNDQARYDELVRILDETPQEDFPGFGSTSLRGKVPAAPFVMDTNQWTSLALKRMVRWATDNGFDQIAWTTGKQQAKRYDLSKQVDKITYMPPEPGSDMYFTGAEDKNGNLIQGYKADGTLDELAEIYGTDIAEKMRKGEGTPNPEDPKQIDLTGVDLEIGGEGMEGFYDKILVDRAKKLGKQYGSKVDKGNIVTNTFQYEIKEVFPETFQVRYPGRDGGFEINEFTTMEEAEKFALNFPADEQKTEVWTMNLTDKLKKAAVDGLPYYVALPPIAAGVQRESERQQINQIQAQQNAQRINAQ